MSYFGEDEEYPGLARYQRSIEAYRVAQAKCATAARLHVDAPLNSDAWVSLAELKVYVEKMKTAEKEFNDAEFCYRHPDRAHERG